MKKVVKAAVVTLASLVGVGCATIKTDELTAVEATQLQDKSMVLTQYNELPDFSATTAVNVQFGLIGALTAIENGNTIIENNKIEDPARSVAEKLAEGITDNYQVTIATTEHQVPLKTKVKGLIELHSDFDYILDVKSLGWGSMYFTSDWNNYIVSYRTHARLIEVATEKVIAEEVCLFWPEFEDTNAAPSYEELENGVGLKRELDKAVDYCVNHIRTMAKLHAETNTPEIAEAN